jgi:PAS domain S-box-containing protein
MEQIRRQESQYARSLIEASLDPLFTINPEGKITDINDATIDVTHVTREKMIGSNFIGYFIEPDKASEIYKKVLQKVLCLVIP